MSKKKNIQSKVSFLEKLDNHLEKRETIYFWSLFGICLLFCFLLYDPRVSQAGDDSAYILRALDFGKKFTYPGFQGPMYPIMLSPITLLFGISLFPLKLFSLISMMGFFYFSYRAFRKKIPATLLFTFLLLTAINSQVLYYASQTFSEAFYMFIQSLILFIFFRFFMDSNETETKIAVYIKRYAWLALALLALALTRSVGFSGIIAVAGYFICYRQWKKAGISLLCFALLFLGYQGLKWAIWGDGGIQFSGQGSSLLSKDYYHPESGKEDIAGLFVRFWDNSRLYLSETFPFIAGVKKARPEANLEGMLYASNTLTTLLVYTISAVALFFSYKKNKNIFFAGILCGSFLLVSFVSLQSFWYQTRLIIPAYPLMILLCFSALYYLLSSEKYRSWQFMFIIPVIILFFAGMTDTAKSISAAQKLKNEYSGLTPDWVHYGEASAWIGKNLSANEMAASRKPSLSTIYSKGKEFYGIYNVAGENPQKFLEDWKLQPDKYFVISDSDGRTHYENLHSHIHARIGFSNSQFILIKKNEATVSLIESLQLPVINPAEFISTAFSDPKNPPLIYCPDTLLNLLKEAKVTHILSANLRSDPSFKGGGTISTVERYMYIIAEKYPNAFTLVQQIGQNDDEPAYIFKINWESIGD